MANTNTGLAEADALARERREAMLSLLSDHEVSTQQEIVERLEQEGIHADRSTISRDLAALGYERVSGTYQLRIESASELAEHEARERLSMHCHAVYEISDRVTCLQTDLGCAEAVALSLIGMRDQWGYMGITHGLDTVMIASRARGIAARIRELASLTR